MMAVRTLWVVFAAVMAAGGRAQGQGLQVAHIPNTDTVPLYEVFEITFQHEGTYENPFFDVDIEAVFTAPDGGQKCVGGFHYGSTQPAEIRTATREAPHGERKDVTYHFARQDTWKLRFAPHKEGRWTYVYTFRNRTGAEASGDGAFVCVKGRRPEPGFLRIDPKNPFRFVHDDGRPYYPIGIQDCWGDSSGTGSVLAACSMEGPFRTDLKDPPPLPAGPKFVRGPAENPQNADVYFRTFSQCGFNLYRFSQQNCSYVLYRDLDHYLVQEGIMTDELVRCARKYGLRFMYGIFGYQNVFNDEPGDEAKMARVKRFIEYTVNRWGAYVDIWEFLNEQNAADGWYEIMVPYLRSIDPYGHPITTSWERPHLEGIEINAPHWYQRENELDSDHITAGRAGDWKKHNKPVIVGEQGNHIDKSKPQPPGVGGVWDDRSGVRMRIRNWTALFTEIAVIFWNTSYARDGHFMNIWLGPEERQYVRAMQDFAGRLGSGVRPGHLEVSKGRAARGYVLASKDVAAAYVHHSENHSEPLKDLEITVDVPRAGKGYWCDPATAAIISTVDVGAGRQTLRVPAFAIDIALMVTADGPFDIDGDGIPNDRDRDNDNDGTPDATDAFPLDPSEQRDADADGIGDNLDADDDGDGTGDDKNGNGTPDHEEMDFDGDGVDRARAAPWDVFPLDGKESRDTDGDGIGDNADTDDDGDGYADKLEEKEGTDPKDNLSFPADLP